MDEKQKAEAFSAAVDRMLRGNGRTDFEVPSSEMSELLALARCLAESRYVPSRPSFQRDLERSLLRHLTRKENQTMNKIKTFLAPSGWKTVLASGLLILALGVGLLLTNPTVRAQVGEWLQWTGVHEVEEIPDWKVEHTELPGPGPLDEAQAQATFRILQPTYLPKGYRFGGANAHHIHDEFATGPTIALHYYKGRSSIYIQEFQARFKVDEAIELGYSQEVTVNGRQAIYINGEWEIDQDRTLKEWKTGRADHLLFEVGDVVVWMQAERPPLGPEELVKIAESFQ